MPCLLGINLKQGLNHEIKLAILNLTQKIKSD